MRTIVPHAQQVLQNEIAKALQDKHCAPERRVVPCRDQVALLRLDIRQILTGEVEVIADREPPRR